MSLWKVIGYVGRHVMDGFSSAGHALKGLSRMELKIGEYYWDRGEYLGDGVFFAAQTHSGYKYTEGDHVMRFSLFVSGNGKIPIMAK